MTRYYEPYIQNKMTEFYTERFSVCPNITSNFRTTVIFKSNVKQNNVSNKACSYVLELLLYQTSFV
jgi:hypothetical protein